MFTHVQFGIHQLNFLRRLFLVGSYVLGFTIDIKHKHVKGPINGYMVIIVHFRFYQCRSWAEDICYIFLWSYAKLDSAGIESSWFFSIDIKKNTNFLFSKLTQSILATFDFCNSLPKSFVRVIFLILI